MEHTTYVKNGVVDHKVFRKPQADVCISLNHRMHKERLKHGDGSGASILLFGSRRTVPLLPGLS
jgi:hypothetical protein